MFSGRRGKSGTVPLSLSGSGHMDSSFSQADDDNLFGAPLVEDENDASAFIETGETDMFAFGEAVSLEEATRHLEESQLIPAEIVESEIGKRSAGGKQTKKKSKAVSSTKRKRSSGPMPAQEPSRKRTKTKSSKSSKNVLNEDSDGDENLRSKFADSSSSDMDSSQSEWEPDSESEESDESVSGSADGISSGFSDESDASVDNSIESNNFKTGDAGKVRQPAFQNDEFISDDESRPKKGRASADDNNKTITNLITTGGFQNLLGEGDADDLRTPLLELIKASEVECNLSDSDLSDSDMDALMYGIGTQKKTVTQELEEAYSRGRKKKRKKARRPLFSPKVEKKRKRKTAAEPTEMSEEASLLQGQATTAWVEDRMSDCIKYCAEVIKLAPGNFEPYHLLGMAYEKIDPRRAVEFHLIAAHLVPGDTELWRTVGEASLRDNNLDQAIHAFRRCIRACRNPASIDLDVALQLADCYTTRLEFVKASSLLQVVFERDPLEREVGMKLAACYHESDNFQSAISVLETLICIALPGLQCIRKRKIQDAQAFSSDQFEDLNAKVLRKVLFPNSSPAKTNINAPSSSDNENRDNNNETSEETPTQETPFDLPESELQAILNTPELTPRQLREMTRSPEFNWEILRQLCESYLFTHAIRPCRDLLLLCLGPEELSDNVSYQLLGPSASNWRVKINDVAASFVVQLTCCEISLFPKECIPVVRRTVDHLTTSLTEDEVKSQYSLFVLLADHLLNAQLPDEALPLYERVQKYVPAITNTSFWIKLASCFLKMQDMTRAAKFLQDVVHNTNLASSSVTSGSDLPVAARIRYVQARLLLCEVLSHLGKPSDVGEMMQSCDALALNNLGCTSKKLFSTSECRLMSLGHFSLQIPPPLDPSQRQAACLRLYSLLRTMRELEQITCRSQVRKWCLHAQHARNILPHRTAHQQIVKAHLDAKQHAFYTAGDCELTELELFSEIEDSSLQSLSTEIQAASGELQIFCDASACTCNGESLACKRVLQRFMSFKRNVWLSEFFILIKDCNLDSQRVVLESSKRRAEKARLALRKTDSGARPAGGIYHSSDISEAQKSGRKKIPENDSQINKVTDPIGSAEIQPKHVPLINVISKSALTKFKQKQQVATRYGLGHPMFLHFKLRADLGLSSLDSLLGWKDFAALVSVGVSFLVRENETRLAVHIIETVLASNRISRAQGVGSYSFHRIQFRHLLKKLSLKLGIAAGLSRISLSAFRVRFLPPVIQKASRSDKNSLLRLRLGLFAYAKLLFSGEHAARSNTALSALPDKDVMLENRAWVIRQLLQRPRDPVLTMISAHFCSLACSWSFSVAEYTRALRLRPKDVLPLFCLAVSYIGFSASRSVQDKHQVVLRGLALFQVFLQRRREQALNVAGKSERSGLLKIRKVIKNSVQDKRDSPGFLAVKALLKLWKERKGELSNKELSTCGITAAAIKYARSVYWLVRLTYEAECEYNIGKVYNLLALYHLAVPHYLMCLKLTLLSDSLAKNMLETDLNALEKQIRPRSVVKDPVSISEVLNLIEISERRNESCRRQPATFLSLSSDISEILNTVSSSSLPTLSTLGLLSTSKFPISFKSSFYDYPEVRFPVDSGIEEVFSPEISSGNENNNNISSLIKKTEIFLNSCLFAQLPPTSTAPSSLDLVSLPTSDVLQAAMDPLSLNSVADLSFKTNHLASRWRWPSTKFTDLTEKDPNRSPSLKTEQSRISRQADLLSPESESSRSLSQASSSAALSPTGKPILKKLMKHPYENLFIDFGSVETRPAIVAQAQAELLNYRRNLPLGMFWLGVDLQQLQRLCGLNLTNILCLTSDWDSSLRKLRDYFLVW